MTGGHLSVRERIGTIERRARRFPPVRNVMSVLDAYHSAGGGLLAGGLAFSALFAIVPGLLLVASVLVLIVDDPEARAAAIDWIVDSVPPLADVAKQIVDNLANSARVSSVVGFIGFLWGASGFYMALDAALNRFFPARRGRDAIMGRVRSMIAVLLLVGGVLVAFVTSTILAGFVVPFRGLSPILSPLIAVCVASGVCLACYRLVPISPPPVRSSILPACAAGVFIGLLTSLFSLIGGFLVAGVSGLGLIASVFVALIWFHYVFQALLYGAAFARLRDVQTRYRRYRPII
ncbi:MAG: YihY/virulence factor BrkB family protein [Chloroflexi bacterium]|nr:YihY/virulence factor BrkB family protein [Chloroflexota bacterium]